MSGRTISPRQIPAVPVIVDAWWQPVANGTITFDTSGQFVNSSGTINVPGSPGALTPTIVTLDLSGMTMLATANSAALGSQDGLAAGSLMGFTVSSSTGEIYGTYSNGDQRLIGQLALAMFVNPCRSCPSGWQQLCGWFELW